MIAKPLKEINLDDIQDLITNSIAEGKTLDYKTSLTFNRDSDKKELIYDISSFANAQGGDIIFGIEEMSGCPTKIVGIKILDIDKLLLDLDAIFRSTIEPRLPAINYHSIKTQNNYYVFIIRVSKSWIKPHLVTFQGTDKFYTRSTNGKYRMDIVELRNQFLNSFTLKDKIFNFKNLRVSEIISNNGAIPLVENGKIIIHIIPYNSFETQTECKLELIYNDKELTRPFGYGGFNTRYNFDGLLSYRNETSEVFDSSYFQLFRNGIIENVDSFMIKTNNTLKLLYVQDIIDLIKYSFSEIPRLYEKAGIGAPYLIFMSITGVREFELGSGKGPGTYLRHKLNKDILNFAELIIEQWSDLEIKLKPWFDALWNSVGIPPKT